MLSAEALTAAHLVASPISVAGQLSRLGLVSKGEQYTANGLPLAARRSLSFFSGSNLCDMICSELLCKVGVDDASMDDVGTKIQRGTKGSLSRAFAIIN